MSYLVADGTYVIKRYDTEGGAKRALTRKWSKKYPNAKVHESYTFYHHVDHDVQVMNIMSGKMVTIKASQVGSCVDPSTERYWSM